MICYNHRPLTALDRTNDLGKKFNSFFPSCTIRMSYIYSDLQRSAKITLIWLYGDRLYQSFIKRMKGEETYWYIDDRARPQDFWALMSIAHPEYCSEWVTISKNKIKRGIDLIFAHKDQICEFEKGLKNGNFATPSFLEEQSGLISQVEQNESKDE